MLALCAVLLLLVLMICIWCRGLPNCLQPKYVFECKMGCALVSSERVEGENIPERLKAKMRQPGTNAYFAKLFLSFGPRMPSYRVNGVSLLYWVSFPCWVFCLTLDYVSEGYFLTCHCWHCFTEEGYFNFRSWHCFTESQWRRWYGPGTWELVMASSYGA